MTRVFEKKHLRNLTSGFVANLLGVLATSLILVRIVAEQGETQLSGYVYHIAIINVISSVVGAGVSNYLIRNWGENNQVLAGQCLTTTTILAPLTAMLYLVILPDSSVILALILLLVTMKRALTSILRVLRNFDALLKISLVEFLAIVTFFVLNWRKVPFSWTVILVWAYALSSLILYRELFSLRPFSVRLSKSSYLRQRELYLFFGIALLQSLGLYGERFVIKGMAGSEMMTVIFQETYVYRLGLTVFTVLSGLVMAYLGATKLTELYSYLRRYSPHAIGGVVLCCILLFGMRPELNRTLLLFDSSLTKMGNVSLLFAFFLYYVVRLLKPVLTKFGRHQEIILCEILFTSIFLVSLLYLQQSLNTTNYALSLLLANLASLVFLIIVLRRLQNSLKELLP